MSRQKHMSGSNNQRCLAKYLAEKALCGQARPTSSYNRIVAFE